MRVVIAEDSLLLRAGLAKLLEEAGFDVVGQAGDAAELLLKVRSYSPDVAIVDVRMPPTQTDEGAEAAETIRAEHPDVGVLLLSQTVETRRALRLFSEHPAGFGYLLKDRVVEVDDFLDAVRRVARGGTALDPEVISRSSSGATVPTIRSRRSRSASARCSRSWPRAARTRGSAASSSSARRRSRPTSTASSANSVFETISDDHRRVLAVLAFLERR